MNKENLNKLIKEFQEKKCKKSQQILFKKYYYNGCKWAKKYIEKNTYTNLIAYENSEIDSYVFLSFWKALTTYKFDSANSLSFKNYFFQLIKYQTYSEMKHNLNWRAITNYKEKKREYIQQHKEDADYYNNQFNKLDANMKCEIIINFLLSKNPIYAQIFKLKSLGFKNADICKKLDITTMEMKSKYQYIKKLILEEFPSIDAIS